MTPRVRVGVALDAVGSFLVTSLNDRARWRREQSVRWDERRLDAYGAYLHVVEELAGRCQSIAAGRGLVTGPAPLELTAEVLDELSAAEARSSALGETGESLGDADTNTASKTLNHCLWRLEHLARGVPTEEEAQGHAVMFHGGPGRTSRSDGVEASGGIIDVGFHDVDDTRGHDEVDHGSIQPAGAREVVVREGEVGGGAVWVIGDPIDEVFQRAAITGREVVAEPGRSFGELNTALHDGLIVGRSARCGHRIFRARMGRGKPDGPTSCTVVFVRRIFENAAHSHSLMAATSTAAS
ncbi:hypothetical protein [Streptomyces sp. WMMB303]|uniref:hypothetical protein n=1 Tax=Streptomyces sp. WMMB303 TaxID=3034154 RepID=UPI0023EC402D|nr:hypothetical protein [Streptomyces sp. WMMB303]MDF4252533.1 hypothetical protein [Streptomyces sp. WMMB303]